MITLTTWMMVMALNKLCVCIWFAEERIKYHKMEKRGKYEINSKIKQMCGKSGALHANVFLQHRVRLHWPFYLSRECTFQRGMSKVNKFPSGLPCQQYGGTIKASSLEFPTPTWGVASGKKN